MDKLLQLLRKNARESYEDLAKMLDIPVEDVSRRIREYEAAGVIRGYQALLNTDRLDGNGVRAVIELRVRPESAGGFDVVARRISGFRQVETMFLVSGAYDLLLFVKGESLQEVANFVSVNLASLDGVLSTSTHFMLKTYKDQGVLMEDQPHDDRLQVCP